MLDWNKPLQLRNGLTARLMGRLLGRSRPNVVAYADGDHEDARQYNDNGEYADDGRPHPYDVINVPPKTMRIDLVGVSHSAIVYQRTSGATVLVIQPELMPSGVTSKQVARVKLPDFIDVEVIE